MTMKEFDPARLDVRAFAQAEGTLDMTQPLEAFARLSAEAVADAAAQPQVHWSAHGELRTSASGAATPWLHLEADAALPLTCQRCLQPMQAPLQVDRWFRFVADEQTAALEDEEAEEDVLVISRDFDLLELVEDELLMDLPVAPRHDTCPTEVPMTVQDEDFEAATQARPNPFAALGGLKKKS